MSNLDNKLDEIMMSIFDSSCFSTLVERLVKFDGSKIKCIDKAQ